MIANNRKALRGWALAVILLSALPASAQTRILAGGQAGSSFGNLYAGVLVAVEQPLGRRFELDARDVFAPVEQHIALGNGWANQTFAGGIVWLTRSLGVNGSAEYSSYHVSIAKHAEYAFGGIVWRKSIQQSMPVRFTFDYLRQLHNGIDATGTESAHLQGGQFNMDMRVKCAGPFCYRVAFDFKVGRVLTQSNPVCDGAFGGPVTCARTAASSGAFTGSLSIEFPRRRATETDAF